MRLEDDEEEDMWNLIRHKSVRFKIYRERSIFPLSRRLEQIRRRELQWKERVIDRKGDIEKFDKEK